MNSTELPVRVGRFARQYSSTPQGARLARHACAEQLDAWGIPYGSDAHDVLRLVVAELCANAVQHGHVPGRDIRVRLTVEAAEPPPSPEGLRTAAGAPGRTAVTVRVEVTDSRAERLPVRGPVPADAPPADAPPGGGEQFGGERVDGRGLYIVEAVADRWGWDPRTDGPGKTVWAEYTVTYPATTEPIA
ncbi:ATP-binding protein [Streptomyces sp. Ru87]|uniref:ATP-binding protein n=1 Tax=Streptomyces sp. Ru87 TaxID=2044307 RepID=UPI000BF4E69C|nr:ATP-binding protein [Streptomyces sp. Ru87]PGH50331.1 ATP-binding protein [Streptomyces sp. Ru87]